ncbi:MAG: type II CAAX prenyl endopeptidase Rce1 family protein [Clostridia bacterium]
MGKIDVKISLSLSFLCFISGFFVVPYQMNTMKTMMPGLYHEMLKNVPVSMGMLTILSALQLFLIAFVLSWIGLKVARSVGFSFRLLDSLVTNQSRIIVEKNVAILAAVLGLLTALVISLSDRLVFQQYIPLLAENKPVFSFDALAAGVLYGGIFEEILLRLVTLSLLVWLFSKVFKTSKGELPALFYWIAILVSTILFALGHLPATRMFFGEVTPLLLVRSLLLNGIGGLFFGYLYWKKGFEYAILAHMFSHIWLQLVVNPLVY